MLNIVRSYPSVSLDNDFNYCPAQQIVYQKDMSKSVPYDINYFNKYISYKDTDIAKSLNNSRIELVANYNCEYVLDIGIGSGEFIEKAPFEMYGFDVNPVGLQWLQDRNILIDPYVSIPNFIQALTFWDVIEHIPEPQILFNQIRRGCHLFTSLPIFKDVTKFRESKHFKPNEHFYFFSKDGFIEFMGDSGFDCLEVNAAETFAGREDILTFAFRKFT